MPDPSLVPESSGASPCILLNQPQLAENIGAVARVMANFGLSDLRLIRPRDGWPQERAWPSASGANWPLDNARVFDSVEAASADLQIMFATTARPRELELPLHTPREASQVLHQAVSEGLKVGLLFGGERAGLETADIALCQGIVTIPIDESFRSLNLAQAVSITAYEWRLGVNDRPRAGFDNARSPPATQEALVGLYEHIERELDDAGFFHPPEKRPSVVKNLRASFARSQLTLQDVATWRGVVTALSRGRGRVLHRLADQVAAKVPKPGAGQDPE
jgi:tRNA/rRNA methyltransferase